MIYTHIILQTSVARNLTNKSGQGIPNGKLRSTLTLCVCLSPNRRSPTNLYHGSSRPSVLPSRNTCMTTPYMYPSSVSTP